MQFDKIIVSNLKVTANIVICNIVIRDLVDLIIYFNYILLFIVT